jgi:hypothetical protein
MTCIQCARGIYNFYHPDLLVLQVVQSLFEILFDVTKPLARVVMGVCLLTQYAQFPRSLE